MSSLLTFAYRPPNTYLNQYQEQGGCVDSIEERYKLDISDSIRTQSETANIFDIKIDEENFVDLTPAKLLTRKNTLSA
jgi:hypothetical protein